MGCDIHSKTYLYDRNSADYIDIDDINKNLDDDHTFPYLVGDRYYDLFGLFGNRVRSRFPQMPELTKGCPSFFELKDPEDFNDPDYYGFTHSTPSVLKNALNKYNETMKNGNILCSERNSYGIDCLSHEIDCLSIGLDNIVKRIDSYYKISRSTKFKMICDLYGYHFDIDKTVFVFWFDN